jgi:hypothetical protein
MIGADRTPHLAKARPPVRDAGETRWHQHGGWGLKQKR